MKWLYGPIFILFILFSLSFSQIQKGTIIGAGSIDFGHLNYNDNYYDRAYTYISFQPQMGYFMSESMALGLLVDYDLNIEYPTGTSGSGVVIYNDLDLGLFYRFYYLKNKFNPYLEPKIYGSLSNVYLFDILYLSMNLGVDYFIAKNISIEPSFSYKLQLRPEDGLINQRFHLNIGIGAFIFN